MIRRSLVPLAALLVLAAGCGGANRSGIAKVAEAERARTAVQGQDVQALAPQAFAEAEQALRAAREAERAGDGVAAELHAERAVASYQHAIAIARLARATEAEGKAREALAQAVETGQRFGAARKAAEREADDVEKQIKVAREAERPAASGPADPERERARLVAAQSLVTQARLLCSAARLVSATAPGLAEAEAATADLEKKLDANPRPAPIDAAGRVRASCLGVLTRARRAQTADPDQSDALLGELSRARVADATSGAANAGAGGKAASDLAPSRDERGVVVTLRGLFQGDKLKPEGETALKELGKVAAAHPGFGVQVVLHEATPPTPGDTAAARKRGETIAKTLGDAGAARTKVELAGNRAPVIDPLDTRRRERNARVEVVFVGGS